MPEGIGFPAPRQLKMAWLINYYGSVHGPAEEFSRDNSRKVMRYNQVMGNDRLMLMQACDEFHEALRKQDGILSPDEEVVLCKLREGHAPNAHDAAIMRQVYCNPASWKTHDFSDANYTTLFSRFGRSAYGVAKFQCSKWFELFTSMPDIPALCHAAQKYCAETGKKIPLQITPGQERALRKDKAMVEIGKYKVRNRNGAWEAHKTIFPWEMEFSPHGWHLNKLLFEFGALEPKPPALGAWLDGLPPELRTSVLGLKAGKNIYFRHGGMEIHATRRLSKIRISEDNRKGGIVEFVNWAQEEKGITPYKLYGRKMHFLAPALESYINNAFIIVKMAVPEIMPGDMAKPSTLSNDEMRKKAIRIYPDWDDWFLHHYPEQAGRNDGIVKFGKGCGPVQMPKEKPAPIQWKGKPQDAGAIPLPCFVGGDARLPLRRKVEKFFIEKIGSYSVHLAEAARTGYAVQALADAEREAKRKGFAFSAKARNAVIREAVRKMIDDGKCLRLVIAGAITHNIPEWYAGNAEHGRFWMQALADEAHGGDVCLNNSGDINRAGLGRYLKVNRMSPRIVFGRYFAEKAG